MFITAKNDVQQKKKYYMMTIISRNSRSDIYSVYRNKSMKKGMGLDTGSNSYTHTIIYILPSSLFFASPLE